MAVTLSLLPLQNMQYIWRQEMLVEARSHSFLSHAHTGRLGTAPVPLPPAPTKTLLLPSPRLQTPRAKRPSCSTPSFAKSTLATVPPSSPFLWLWPSAISTISFVPGGLLGPAESFDSIIGSLSALRGGWSLARQYGSLIEQGPFRTLFTMDRDVTPRPLSQRTRRALYVLDAENLASNNTERAKVTYGTAIQVLRRSYGLVSERPNTWMNIIQRPTAVSHDYFALLRQKQDMALIIFAHWCVPVHHASYKWYMEGWAARAGQVVSKSLDPIRTSAVRWPLKDFDLHHDIFDQDYPT